MKNAQITRNISITLLGLLDLALCVILYITLLRKKSDVRILFDKRSNQAYAVRETMRLEQLLSD